MDEKWTNNNINNNDVKLKTIYTGDNISSIDLAPYYDPCDIHECIKVKGILKDPQDPYDPYYRIYENNHDGESDIIIKEYCKICHKIMNNNVKMSETKITKISEIEKIR